MKIFGDAKLKRTAAAAGVTAALILLLALRYDFWFDINDDVWMKDIISGVYTGTPSARNIQMLFPVSGLVSLFYRIPRSVDWYGLFLLACQFGSLFLVQNLRKSRRRPRPDDRRGRGCSAAPAALRVRAVHADGRDAVRCGGVFDSVSGGVVRERELAEIVCELGCSGDVRE